MVKLLQTLALISVLSSALLISETSYADQTRWSVATGIVSAGTVSGGLAVAPLAGYSFKIDESFEFVLTNRVVITGITYHNIGFINYIMPTIGYTWKDGSLDIGPSLDVIDTILCGNEAFCNRVVGIVPGAQANIGFYRDSVFRGRLGLQIDIHMTYMINGAIYHGPLFSATLGPILRTGLI